MRDEKEVKIKNTTPNIGKFYKERMRILWDSNNKGTYIRKLKHGDLK